MTLGFASTTFASPISVQVFDGSQLGDSDSAFYDAFGSMTPGFIIEDFEDPTSLSGNLEAGGTIAGGGGTGEITAGESLGSSVGMFTSFGGTGDGSTCQRLSTFNDTCTSIGYQMDAPVNEQGNTIPFEGLYSVNSADTEGMSWTADTGSLFDELVFVLRDPGDQGQKTLTIAAAGETYRRTTPLPNEELLLVRVLFEAHPRSSTSPPRSMTRSRLTGPPQTWCRFRPRAGCCSPASADSLQCAVASSPEQASRPELRGAVAETAAASSFCDRARGPRRPILPPCKPSKAASSQPGSNSGPAGWG